jgi:hypothetical protein
MTFDPKRKLSDQQALIRIREIVDTGEVRWGKHLRDRLSDRNFTIRDILYILRNGKVIKAEFDDDRQNWKYSVKGHDLEGVDGTVVTAIIGRHEIYLITAC